MEGEKQQSMGDWQRYVRAAPRGMETVLLDCDWVVSRWKSNEADLPDEWDKLNARCRGANPFLSRRFATRLARYFGSDDFWLATLNMEGRCVGMALLVRKSIVRWQVFQPAQAPLGMIMLDDSVIDSDSAFLGLLSRLPATVVQLDVMCIDSMHFVGSPTDSRIEESDHVMTMSIESEGSFAEYMRARSKSLKKNLRRYDNKLAREGLPWSVERLETGAQVGLAVEEHGDLEESGWKGVEKTAIGIDTVQGQFYKDWMIEEAQNGCGVVYRLMVADRLAASRLVVLRNGMAVIVKTAYNESLARFSVGKILLREVIRDLFSREEVRSIEFYTNASVEQLQWCTDSRWIKHQSVYRNGMVRPAKAIVRRVRGMMGSGRVRSGRESVGGDPS